MINGFRQKPLRLRNPLLASLQGLLPEPWMTNIYQAGVLVNHEAKLKGGCEAE